MGTDVFDIFDKCVHASKSTSSKDFYDFEFFLRALKAHGDETRTMWMVQSIIKAMCNDPADFLSLATDVLRGDFDDDIAIIRSSCGRTEIIGDIPNTLKLTISGNDETYEVVRDRLLSKGDAG